MARLIAFGADNGTHDLDALDTVDLKATRLAQEWGAETNGHKERGWTFSSCDRPNCGGAIVSGWGFDGCMLCGRNGSEPVVGQRRRYEHDRTGRD